MTEQNGTETVHTITDALPAPDDNATSKVKRVATIAALALAGSAALLEGAQRLRRKKTVAVVVTDNDPSSQS